MTDAYDTRRWAERRRPLDALEARVVQIHLKDPDVDAQALVETLRYVISFARLTGIQNPDGLDVDVSGPLGLHALFVKEELTRRLTGVDSLWEVIRALPDLVSRTRAARKSLLDHLPIDRDALEREVTTRKLAVVSGGGGGAGYVYPGCYEMLERAGMIPDLMVGTSIGALMSMFRARRRRWDPVPMVTAARKLSWSTVFRVLETQNRYGIPATLRLYLRAALGSMFEAPDGRPLWISDMEIPLFIISTGITVDALKHDLGYYEHLLDEEVGAASRFGVRSSLKTIGILREFLARRDALVQIVLGREEGTEDFDVLDAAGFSAAIPGVIHYDVLRPDQRMHRILDQLYASYGITRLGEGGMTANVAARVAWETFVSGRFGHRNVFVIGLDCFAPNPRALAWYALQQLVYLSNTAENRPYCDLYVPLTRTLSPINLVPPLRDALEAMRWGREQIGPHIPFVKAMVAPIPVLAAEG